VFDLRLKAILDDGNRAVRTLFNAEMTEAVSKVSLDDAMEMASEALDPSVVETELRELLIGRTYDIRGPVIGEYFLVDEVEEISYSGENAGLSNAALADAATQRQPAKRVFAEELNMATHSFTRPEDEGDDRAPKFTLLPSGEAVYVSLQVDTTDNPDTSGEQVLDGSLVINANATAEQGVE